MLKLSFERKYFSRNNNLTFVYKVTGAEADVKKYVEAKVKAGAKRESIDCPAKDGEAAAVRFYTTRYQGKSAELIETGKQDWIVDDTKKQIFLNTLAQCNGNVPAALHILGMEQAPE